MLRHNGAGHRRLHHRRGRGLLLSRGRSVLQEPGLWPRDGASRDSRGGGIRTRVQLHAGLIIRGRSRSSAGCAAGSTIARRRDFSVHDLRVVHRCLDHPQLALEWTSRMRRRRLYSDSDRIPNWRRLSTRRLGWRVRWWRVWWRRRWWVWWFRRRWWIQRRRRRLELVTPSSRKAALRLFPIPDSL